MLKQRVRTELVPVFTGKIVFYWTGYGDKPDMPVTVHNGEMRAAFEVYHGLLGLEGNSGFDQDAFDLFMEDIINKCEHYAEKIMRLKRLKPQLWSWDWE